MTKFISRLTSWFGSIPAICAAASLIVGWFATGPIFRFSEGHSLFINTTTTVITFLMVFVIQNTQNRETKAMNLKLDKLIELSEASNRIVGIEEESERAIEEERQRIREEVEDADR